MKRLNITAHVYNASGFKVAVVPAGQVEVQELRGERSRTLQSRALNFFEAGRFVGEEAKFDGKWERHTDGAGLPYGLLITDSPSDGGEVRIRYYAREVS